MVPGPVGVALLHDLLEIPVVGFYPGSGDSETLGVWFSNL